MYVHRSLNICDRRVLQDLSLGFRRAVGEKREDGAETDFNTLSQHLLTLHKKLRLSFPVCLLNYYVGCALPCQRTLQIQIVIIRISIKSSSLCFNFPIYKSFLEPRLCLWYRTQ